MPFTTPDLVLRSVGPGRWQLADDLVYVGRQETFIVPAGFETDMASVPQPLLWLIPRDGAHTAAAVLHDWLVTEGIASGLSSRDADGIFRRVLRETRAAWPAKRWLIWTAVRIGAWFSATRRPGSLSTLPQVLSLALLALPVVVPPAALAALAYAVYTLVDTVSGVVAREWR